MKKEYRRKSVLQDIVRSTRKGTVFHTHDVIKATHQSRRELSEILARTIKTSTTKMQRFNENGTT